MAFADPQTIVNNGVAITLPLISSNETESVYQSPDENHTLRISHQLVGKGNSARWRRLVSYEVRKIAADPLTAVNTYVSSSVRTIIDEPVYGFTDLEQRNNVKALHGFHSDANIDKVLGNQH